MKKPTIKSQVDKYVREVLSGKIVACKWVKLACQRYKDDMKNRKAKGLVFSQKAAERNINFIQQLKHSKGEWAGKFVILEPWELFVSWNIFGWMKPDGNRRFRTAYLEVARKNGKSTYISGIGNYLAFADGEAGAEVFSAATKLAQAKITHEEAKRMVLSSELKKHIKIFRDNLSHEASHSKYEPLGADAKTADGLNVHGGLIDELHEHPNRDMWDVLDTGTGSRSQSLIFSITTAGFDRHSICWEQHAYTEKILEGAIEDDTFFGIIFTIDAGDNWEDESVWMKANPNLGVSVKLDDLQRKAKRAKEIPSQLNAFLRKHLNVWTESVERWLPAEQWKECNEWFEEESLINRTCYAGLDLASTQDTASLVYVFPPEDYSYDLSQDISEITCKEPFKVICKTFIPENNMQIRVRRDRVPYDVWAREGFIIPTEGNVIDYNFILATLQKDLAKYYIKELAFDRWGAGKIIQDLQEMGFEDESEKFQDRTLIQFGQGFGSMSSPSKQLAILVGQKKISHNDNPVLSWMASNAVIRVDPAENIKPDKEKSTERIDGIVSLVMGVGRAVLHKQESSAGISFI